MIDLDRLEKRIKEEMEDSLRRNTSGEMRDYGFAEGLERALELIGEMKEAVQ